MITLGMTSISYRSSCLQLSRNSDASFRSPIHLGAASSLKHSVMIASSSGRPPLISCCRPVWRTSTSTSPVSVVAAAHAYGVSSPVPIGVFQPTVMLLAAVVQFVKAIWVKAQDAVVATFPQVLDLKAEVYCLPMMCHVPISNSIIQVFTIHALHANRK